LSHGFARKFHKGLSKHNSVIPDVVHAPSITRFFWSSCGTAHPNVALQKALI